MKTRDQKHNDKFSKRVARWWNNFSMRIAQWWINVVDWAEDIDFGEILMNLFFILFIGGVFFGFAYLGVHDSHKNKTDSIADTVAVVDSVQTKSDTADFDTVISDTRVVIKTNRPIKVVVK